MTHMTWAMSQSVQFSLVMHSANVAETMRTLICCDHYTPVMKRLAAIATYLFFTATMAAGFFSYISHRAFYEDCWSSQIL